MSTEIVTKGLTRSDWKRLRRAEFAWTEVSAPELRGVASLHRLRDITAPLVVSALGEQFTIVDRDYAWLQVAPEGEYWWLTAAFDADDRPVQFYFDITRRNFIRGRESSFEDLMLDVIMLPDGRCTLTDEDELDEALALGNITPADHAAAHAEADKLLSALPRRAEELTAFCCGLVARLNAAPHPEVLEN